MAHARVAGPRIVDRDAHTLPAQRRQPFAQHCVVFHVIVLGDFQHQPVRRQFVQVTGDLAADERLRRDVDRYVEVAGDVAQAVERGEDRVEFHPHAQADFARLVEPQVRWPWRVDVEPGQAFDADDALPGQMVDRLVDDAGLAHLEHRGDPLDLFLVQAHGVQIAVDLVGKQIREGAHHVQVAFAKRQVRAQAETAEGAVDAAVAQADGDADVRADGNQRGLRNRGQRRHRGGIRYQLRDAALDHAQAVAFIERAAVAGTDRHRFNRARHVAEGPVVATELGNEGHVHAQMGTHRVEHAIDVVADGQRAGPALGQDGIPGSVVPHDFLLKARAGNDRWTWAQGGYGEAGSVPCPIRRRPAWPRRFPGRSLARVFAVCSGRAPRLRRQRV